jgi:hypothetical protein
MVTKPTVNPATSSTGSVAVDTDRQRHGSGLDYRHMAIDFLFAAGKRRQAMQGNSSKCFRPILTVCLGTLLVASGHGADPGASRGLAPPEPSPVLAAPAAEPAAGTDLSRAPAPGRMQPSFEAPRAAPPGMSRGIGRLQNAPLLGEIRLSPGQLAGLGLQTPVAIKFDALEKHVALFLGSASEYENSVQQIHKIRQFCAMKNYTVQDQKNAGCSGAETLDQCSAKLLAYCIKGKSGSGGKGSKTAAGTENSAQAVGGNSGDSPGDPMGAAISGPVQNILGKKSNSGASGQGKATMDKMAGLVEAMGGGGGSGSSPMQLKQSAQVTASQARTLAQQLNQYASQVEATAQSLTQ